MELILEDSPLGSRACWVLEFVLEAEPGLLYPHLDRFVGGLPSVKPESSIRPLAKICQLLVVSYYDPAGAAERPPLTGHQKEGITAACFDWLISAGKVAPKAFSMQSLLLLGREIPWVHPELKAVIERHYPDGSPAYQARARRILRELG